MTFTYEDAVYFITDRLNQRKSAPPQEERERMDAIEVSVVNRIVFIIRIIIAITFISIVAVLYHQNIYQQYAIALPITLISGLLAFILPFLLYEPLSLNADVFCNLFSKEYKTIFNKYDLPYCSQKSYDNEIIRIIEHTDIFIEEAKKPKKFKVDFNISEINTPDHISVTLYFYDGIDENLKPKYKTQEIIFI